MSDQKKASSEQKAKVDEIKQEKQKQAKNPQQEMIEEDIVLSPEDWKILQENVMLLKKEKDDLLDTAKRTQAEFDNYRKRNATLRTDSHKEGAFDAIEAMIPVLDNFERVIDQFHGDPKYKEICEGLDMICKQMLGVFEKFHVSEIQAQDLPFDPNVHCAIMQEEKAGTEPGMITEVLQKGYASNQKVLRSSMVKVSK